MNNRNDLRGNALAAVGIVTALGMIAFGGTAAYVIGNRMSSEAITLAVGLLIGTPLLGIVCWTLVKLVQATMSRDRSAERLMFLMLSQRNGDTGFIDVPTGRPQGARRHVALIRSGDRAVLGSGERTQIDVRMSDGSDRTVSVADVERFCALAEPSRSQWAGDTHAYKDMAAIACDRDAAIRNSDKSLSWAAPSARYQLQEQLLSG